VGLELALSACLRADAMPADCSVDRSLCGSVGQVAGLGVDVGQKVVDLLGQLGLAKPPFEVRADSEPVRRRVRDPVEFVGAG
jgi:hypothetical protein